MFTWGTTTLNSVSSLSERSRSTPAYFPTPATPTVQQLSTRLLWRAVGALAPEDSLAVRRTKNGSGLGRWRWGVERTLAWLNQFRSLTP